MQSEKICVSSTAVSTPTTRARTWKAGEIFTVHDATELYEVDRWGKGYFSISGDGNVLAHPTKDPARSIDLKQLTDHLMLRGIGLPVLLRFPDILRHRLGDIHNAFKSAINQHSYEGRYVCVYPIKVNQQRHVVEEVLDFGREYGFGLEAGSNPSSWPSWPRPITTRPSSAMASRTPNTSKWRCWPRRSGATSSRW